MKKEFFEKNRKKLYDIMTEKSVLILYSGKAPYKTADEKYDYSVNRNFYYFTGIDQEDVYLVMTKDDEGNVSENIFLQENDEVLSKWVGESLYKDEATEISGVKNIYYLEQFKAFLNSNMSDNKILYCDYEKKEWSFLPDIDYVLKELKANFPFIQIKNIYDEIAEFRMIKEPEEIEMIEKAIKITADGIENMRKNMKSGMYEYEIEAFFNFTLKSNGVKDFAFKTICASGKNAAVLHYVDNDSKTGKNEMVLFDLGAALNHYNADISRTYPLDGKFTERQKEIYEIVLKTNKAIEEYAKPGITMKELNDKAKSVLAEGAVKAGLIKNEEEISKYYFHSIGHQLGLDTHDVGKRNAVLKPGMIITDEPGLYIPEENIGIRIEDDLLITETGCRNLSSYIPKEIKDIEK